MTTIDIDAIAYSGDMQVRAVIDEHNMQIETQAKACRTALWLALVQAQQLGWSDLIDELMVLLRDVDQRRARLDDAAPSATAAFDGSRGPD